VALAVVCGVGAGALATLQHARHRDVYFVNALPVPLVAEVDNVERTLPPNLGPVKVELTVGRHGVGIRTKGGQVVEASVIDVRMGRGPIVWNVAGVAPVVRSTIIYGSEKDRDTAKVPDPDVYCGETLIALDSAVDYPFTTPPAKMSVPESSKTIQKSVLEIFEGGVASCRAKLLNDPDSPARVHALSMLARYSSTAGDLGTNISALFMTGHQDDALRIVREVRDERGANLDAPHAVDFHRVYQDTMAMADKRDEARQQYLERMKREPDSAGAQYLGLRSAPLTASLPELDAAVARFPKHAYLRLLHAAHHYQRLEFKQAQDSFDAMHEADAALWTSSVEMVARNLVGLGDVAEALGTVRGAFNTTKVDDDATRRSLASLYAAVASLDPKADGSKLFRDLPHGKANGPLLVAVGKLRAGVPLDASDKANLSKPPFALLATVAEQVATDPTAALATIGGAGPDEMVLLVDDGEASTLLRCEALRVSADHPALKRLPTEQPTSKESLATFVATGKEDDAFDDLDVTQRAAAYFVRSRVSSLPTAERAQLLARARKLAFVPGPVSRAMANWKS